MTKLKYLGQNTHLKDTTKEEIHGRIIAEWSGFGEKIARKHGKIDTPHITPKTNNLPMCLTNGELWLPYMVS